MINTKSDVPKIVSRLTIFNVIVISIASIFRVGTTNLVLIQGFFTICAVGYAIYISEQKLSELQSEIAVIKEVITLKNKQESKI
jgi:hypothetical protein